MRDVVEDRLRAPPVDYDNWGEMMHIMYTTRASFAEAMKRAVMKDAAAYDARLGDASAATTLHGLRDPIYNDGAISCFGEEARQIIARLAKGTSCTWTTHVADTLLSRVQRVSRIYRDVIVYHHAYDFTHDGDTFLEAGQPVNHWPHLFAFKPQHMYDLMKEEVDQAFGGPCPWNRSSFRNSFVSDLLLRNFHVFDCAECTTLSTKELHAMRLAFAQGTHSRLGAGCALLALHHDLCALIYSSVCLSAADSKQHFQDVSQWLC